MRTMHTASTANRATCVASQCTGTGSGTIPRINASLSAQRAQRTITAVHWIVANLVVCRLRERIEWNSECIGLRAQE